MFAAMHDMLSKMLSPLWRTVEVNDMGTCLKEAIMENLHLCDRVVTHLCLDYGLIDDAVYFTLTEVLGGVPLKVGDKVDCIAVWEGDLDGWKALLVKKNSGSSVDGCRSSPQVDNLRLHPLIGTVTSFDGRSGFINFNTYFSCRSLWKGYMPMKGDWVQAQYYISPDSTTQTRSVGPLRYCRLDQMRVSNVFGRIGVVEDNVIFNLNSLQLPAGYQPLPGELVSLLMVESSQPIYSWRAIYIVPTQLMTQRESPAIKPIPEDEIQSLLQDKDGLEVSINGHFGDLKLGESVQLVFWIHNKSSQTHKLKCCEFAGWDLEHQFTLGAIKEPARQKKTPLLAVGSMSSPGPAHFEQVVNRVKEGEQESGMARQGSKPKPTGMREVDIAPEEKLPVTVHCTAKNLGNCTELLLLHFSSFTIARQLKVIVGCKVERLNSSVPYRPSDDASPVSAPLNPMIPISAPPQLLRLRTHGLPKFIHNYAVPQALRACVEAKNDVLMVQPCLGEVLSSSNMRARFSALLWLEELQIEKEMKEFTITGALLRKGAFYLHLEIPGLSENRPALSIADKVILKKPQCDGMLVEHVCDVAEINGEDVSFRVKKDFHCIYLGEPLDVEFIYNRLNMRRCHQALSQTEQFGQILFPTKLTIRAPQWTGNWLEDLVEEEETTEMNEVMSKDDEESVTSISVNMKPKAIQTKDSKPPSKPVPCKGKFFRPDLNPHQREAVKKILAGESRPIPYVLFGPPGTGKTITLIETILQVYYLLPWSRVLVCTPSNSAADLICLRLHYSGYLHTGSLSRVNANHRQKESIPEVLWQYSNTGNDLQHAAFRRIVVSTCSSAGMFHHIRLKVGHFTHMFLDEAGQATEPEALIPMSLISERDGQIVLAGDPYQLGPLVKSKLASAFGLGVSMLERLMANPLYSRQDWGYNPKLVTKLIDNYRSHEALLQLPSRLFYQGELCMRAPRAIVDSLCHLKLLPNKGFPLIFHGIRGTEMRDGNNPSWFNLMEAVQVMLYCCQLTKRLYKPVDVSDIGIIAPYRKQSEKIRLLLNKVGLSDIKVGSVEEFQGQEFLVTILSTVRSNESMVNKDTEGYIGFLANPKRFNVAITRPKALLIVIGNPHVLIEDLCFKALLDYCFDNKVIIGCDPPPALQASHQSAMTK